MFHRFGTKVTLIEMLPRIVPVEDEEVSKELERTFKKGGIRVETGASAENIQKTDKGVELTVTLANGKTEDDGSGESFWSPSAASRITDDIGLENTRVETDRGFIKVNQSSRRPSRACTRSATSLPERPNWRTSRRWRGWWRSRTSPASRCEPINKTAHSRRDVHRAGHRQRRPDRGGRRRRAGYKVKIGKFAIHAEQHGDNPGSATTAS